MDPEGPWSLEMVEMMLGEALAVETNRKRAQHESTLSAIVAGFSKGSYSYDASMKKVLGTVQDARLEARGKAPRVKADPAVADIKRILRGRRSRGGK